MEVWLPWRRLRGVQTKIANQRGCLWLLGLCVMSLRLILLGWRFAWGGGVFSQRCCLRSSLRLRVCGEGMSCHCSHGCCIQLYSQPYGLHVRCDVPIMLCIWCLLALNIPPRYFSRWSWCCVCIESNHVVNSLFVGYNNQLLLASARCNVFEPNGWVCLYLALRQPTPHFACSQGDLNCSAWNDFEGCIGHVSISDMIDI